MRILLSAYVEDLFYLNGHWFILNMRSNVLRTLPRRKIMGMNMIQLEGIYYDIGWRVFQYIYTGNYDTILEQNYEGKYYTLQLPIDLYVVTNDLG